MQTLAMGTFQMMRSDLSFPAAVQAADSDGQRLGFDARSLGDGAFRQHVQIDLDAVGHDAPESTDAKPDDPDF